MAKERTIVCEYYEYEGKCSKGREGTFHKQCQKCSKYVKKAGARPYRTDERRRRMEKIQRKEKFEY